MAVTTAALVGVATMDYIKQGFSTVSCSGVLEPDLNDTRREIEFATQPINFIALRTRLLREISLQNLPKKLLNLVKMIRIEQESRL